MAPIQTLLGTKKAQLQQFDADGNRIPVTMIQAGPCWVTHITKADGYQMIQLAFGTNKNLTRSLKGTATKAGMKQNPRFFRSVRVYDTSGKPSSTDAQSQTENQDQKPLTIGTMYAAGDVFSVGDIVKVTGISKGKGFAGVVKRHHFRGGPRTHGQSDRERAPGSIGQTTTPGRVYKGKRMAGRMGGKRVTVAGLTVVGVDADKGMLMIKGLVPGATDGLLIIQK